MAVIQIVEFNASSNTEVQSPATIPKDVLAKLKALVGSPDGPSHIQIGTQVQSPSTIQITSEWNNEAPSTDSNPFTHLLHASFGPPSSTYHIPLPPSTSLFTSPSGALTRPTTEFVMSWHPTSRLKSNPSYQQQIEDEFTKFYSIFEREASGASGLTWSWVSGDQEHDDLPAGEAARIFFVANGWDGMEFFEKSTSTESFKQAVPMLYGWGTPFRLWHVDSILAI